jgi:hypothetical protein
MRIKIIKKIKIVEGSQHLGAMVALVTTLLKFFTITSLLLLSGLFLYLYLSTAI